MFQLNRNNRTGNPNRRHRLRDTPQNWGSHKSMTIDVRPARQLEFVCVFGQDGSVLGWLESTCCRTFIATSLGHLVDFDNSKADSQ